MFYIIGVEYVGPNPASERFIDANRVYISETPARTNQSHEVRIDGWCGTTNDWSTTAHGAYETLDGATEAVDRIFGAVRLMEDDGGYVKAFALGEFEPISDVAFYEIFSDYMHGDITVDITDGEFTSIVAEYESILNAGGATLGKVGLEILQDFRDNQVEE